MNWLSKIKNILTEMAEYDSLVYEIQALTGMSYVEADRKISSARKRRPVTRIQAAKAVLFVEKAKIYARGR